MLEFFWLSYLCVHCSEVFCSVLVLHCSRIWDVQKPRLCYLSTSWVFLLTLHFKGFQVSSQARQKSLFVFFFWPVFLYRFLGRGCCWEGHKFVCQSIAVSSCHFISYCKVHLFAHRMFINKKIIKIEMFLGLFIRMLTPAFACFCFSWCISMWCCSFIIFF